MIFFIIFGFRSQSYHAFTGKSQLISLSRFFSSGPFPGPFWVSVVLNILLYIMQKYTLDSIIYFSMEIELKELLRYILVFFYVAYYVFSLFLALLLCQPGLLPFLYNSYCVVFFFS